MLGFLRRKKPEPPLPRDEEISKLKGEIATLNDIAGQRELAVGFCIMLLRDKGMTTFTLDELNHFSATRKLCWYQRNGVFVLETAALANERSN